MHVDLSPHLHTDECNAIIEKLVECRKLNNFGQYFGACNTEDFRMRKCLREERLQRREENFRNSREYKRRQKMERDATA